MTGARLVPELDCSNFEVSLAFYTGVLGFKLRYDRPEKKFAYLEREGAELMLEEVSPEGWLTAELTHPYGRGINFQIEVDDVAALYEAVCGAGVALYQEIEDAWYRAGDAYTGNRQFLVQDPDGYLLRFFQSLGRRDVGPSSPEARVVG
jgi:catechol 2,3-dioxygenase-like lactoylglutathione lyase family enzyme